MSRGDVVLVGFVFSDEFVGKLRPALVISSSAYNRERKEVVVAAITSNAEAASLRRLPDVDRKGAGLLFPSVATGILRTGTRGMVDRKLGTMAKGDLDAVDNGLRPSLAL
jgi:mRNA interferase MazF